MKTMNVAVYKDVLQQDLKILYIYPNLGEWEGLSGDSWTHSL